MVRLQSSSPPQTPAPRYSACKSAPGELLIWLLVRSALRRMFVRVRLHVAGEDPRAARIPLVAIANHPSWWDGYLALLLSRHFGLRRFLMMDAAQLRRYGFFAWAGCFGVDRDDPRDVARALAYGGRLLTQDRNALLWIFPQAEIAPSGARPVVVRGGAAHILRRATQRAPVVGALPVAWQLVFRGEQHAEVIIRTGCIARFDHAGSRDPAAVSERIRDALTETMDALHDDIINERLTAYRVILRGQRGINDRFDRLLNRDPLVADS